jgi:hypothetical protein
MRSRSTSWSGGTPTRGTRASLRRSPFSGSWCGYVAVPPGHPYHGAPYDDVPVEVHGDLTFASYCNEEDAEHGVCHVALPGEPERVYWLGFDFGHFLDMSPQKDLGDLVGAHISLFGRSPHYATATEAMAECADLAGQLFQLAGTASPATASASGGGHGR